VRWVADQLGHKDPALTLRVYTHAMREEETGWSHDWGVTNLERLRALTFWSHGPREDRASGGPASNAVISSRGDGPGAEALQ